jgi:hypothetical protein
LSFVVGGAPPPPPPHRANTISARLVLGGGSAVLIVPISLGWLADQTSISQAFGVVAALLGVILTLAVLAKRREK